MELMSSHARPHPRAEDPAPRAAASSAPLPEVKALLDKARAENFPVALRLLPAELHRHLMAIYGFARLADDLGDEVEGNREALLDWLEADLERAFSGSPEHPLLQRLAPTLRARALPRQPFLDLIEANRRDQRVLRYTTWTELEGYCELSANPVGRLVLYVFGAATPDRVALSNAICTALQLVEHCQDLAEDLTRGRLYLPAEDLARFGCSESDLRAGSAGPELRRLLHFEMGRARNLLHEGEPLVGRLRGWPRLAVAGFTAGGHAAVDAVERRDFDVLSPPTPRPRRQDWMRHWLRLLWQARGSRQEGHLG